MAIELQAEELPKCPTCGSGQVYFRIKTTDYQCRRCGNDFTLPREAVRGKMSEEGAAS